MVPGTSGHHPGHCRIAVRARLWRWDEWLLGAPRHWLESAGEGYPLPREIGRHQPLGFPLDQPPAAVEEIPGLVAMVAANDPNGPLCPPHRQPKVNGRRVVSLRTMVRQLSRFMGPMGPQLSGRLPTGGRLRRRTPPKCSQSGTQIVGSASSSGSAHVGARQVGQGGRAPGSSSPRTSNHSTLGLSPPSRAQTFLAIRVCSVWSGRSLVWVLRGSGAVQKGVRPSAKWAGMLVRDARAEEPVQLLGAAAAGVMPKERGVVVVECFPADAARVPGPRRAF